jgi:hypothetical protein
MKKTIIGIALIFGFILMLNVSSAMATDAPDLSLEKNMVSPSPVTYGQTATLTIEVKNIGKVKSRAVTLFLHGDENALQAFGVPMYNAAEHGVPMPELAAGQVFTYSSSKVIKLPAGNYTIRAIIWPGNKPMTAVPMPNAESNLTNNEKEIQFTVKLATIQPSNLGPKHKIPLNSSGKGVIN